jgi:hypothetical protein
VTFAKVQHRILLVFGAYLWPDYPSVGACGRMEHWRDVYEKRYFDLELIYRQHGVIESVIPMTFDAYLRILESQAH